MLAAVRMKESPGCWLIKKSALVLPCFVKPLLLLLIVQDAYNREDDGISRLLADQGPGIMKHVIDKVVRSALLWL